MSNNRNKDKDASRTPNATVPNYELKCCVCGQTPTVQIVNRKGNVEHETELCGPCCWGEAECIDVDNW